jgi:hypothetical protein
VKTAAVRWTWTWSGLCFGYWIDDELWTYGGKHVGHRIGSDIHAPNGRYVGELMVNGRLSTNKTKAGNLRSVFIPAPPRVHAQRLHDHAGQAHYAGYADFPDPDTL